MAKSDINAASTPAQLSDTAGAAVERALGIVSIMKHYEDHEDEIPPGALANACWAVMRELLAAQEAIDCHYKSGRAQQGFESPPEETAHG